MSKIGQEIIQMYEDGEIIFNEETNCYESTSQEWLEHPFVDQEKERRAGFFNTSYTDEKKEREEESWVCIDKLSKKEKLALLRRK